MPMFAGGGRGARWPGHDYWVDTPGSAGSAQFSSSADFDPFFNAGTYRVDSSFLIRTFIRFLIRTTAELSSALAKNYFIRFFIRFLIRPLRMLLA